MNLTCQVESPGMLRLVGKRAETASGIKVNNEGEWTILVSRYNYIVDQEKQFSSYPALPKINYHHKEYYADLIFE